MNSRTKASVVLWGIVLAVVAYNYSRAQFAPGIPANLATQADITALWAAMPQPANVIPPTDTLNGAIGTSVKYMREDAPRPTISQRTTVTTDASGNFTVTWAKSFVSSTPVISAIPLTASAIRPDCKISTRSATTVTGTCWQEFSLVILTSITVLSTPVAYASSSVMVVGLEPSQ